MVRRTYSKEIHEHQVSQKVQETSNEHTTKEASSAEVQKTFKKIC